MNGPVVLLTGADHGIGFHMTRTLVEDGFYVAGIDLSDENLSSLVADHPDQLLVFLCDVSDATQVSEAVETTRQR